MFYIRGIVVSYVPSVCVGRGGGREGILRLHYVASMVGYAATAKQTAKSMSRGGTDVCVSLAVTSIKLGLWGIGQGILKLCYTHTHMHTHMRNSSMLACPNTGPLSHL